MTPLTLSWVGGEHRFALHLGELRALQEATGRGPEDLLRRLTGGTWFVDEVLAIIRLGLIGGGMEASQAARQVVLLADLHPMQLFKGTALAVMVHALTGPEDDRPGKPQGAETPPASGDGPTSTAPDDTAG